MTAVPPIHFIVYLLFIFNLKYFILREHVNNKANL